MAEKFRARIAGVNDHEEHDVQMKSRYKSYRNKFIIALVVLAVLFYVFTSAKTVTTVKTIRVIETVPNVYDEIEFTNKTFVERVPYNATEFYYEKEGVGKETCRREKYDYDVDVQGYYESKDDVTRYKCQVRITNNGDKHHNWTIRAKFTGESTGLGPESEALTLDIMPGNEKDFIFYLEEGVFKPKTCIHMIEDAPAKEICEYSFYEDVRKSKPVVKFRNRTVIRTIKTTKTFTALENVTTEKRHVQNITINRFFGWRQGFNLGY